MKNISFALTTEKIRQSVANVALGQRPMKWVTRRLGWRHLKVGERLQACEKCMGRRHGEPLVKLCVIEVVSVRRERLGDLEDKLNWNDGVDECYAEGFPATRPAQFVAFFCGSHKGCTPDTEITRIEFKYIL